MRPSGDAESNAVGWLRSYTWSWPENTAVTLDTALSGSSGLTKLGGSCRGSSTIT